MAPGARKRTTNNLRHLQWNARSLAPKTKLLAEYLTRDGNDHDVFSLNEVNSKTPPSFDGYDCISKGLHPSIRDKYSVAIYANIMGSSIKTGILQ